MIGWLKYIKTCFVKMQLKLLARICLCLTLVKWRSFCPGKPHGLPGELIVSLTSYPKRFATLHLTLKCMLMQSVAPDHLILWISHGDREKLTSDILGLQAYGLKIKYCEDIGSYKKIIYTLQDMPNSYIVPADDDLYYWPTWLEELVTCWSGDPKEVVCHRAHLITYGADGLPQPYAKWGYEGGLKETSTLNFPTTGFGALYPPGAFHSDVLNVEKLTKLCPKADDVWLYWMMRLNGVRALKIGTGKKKVTEWPGTQSVASLYHYNYYEGGNDKQINMLIREYGFPDA